MRKFKLRLSKLAVISLVLATMVLLCALSITSAKAVDGTNLPLTASNSSDRNDEFNNDDTSSREQKRLEAASKAAFLEAYRVFMHPRCMNCHPSGDTPLQGDDSHLHTMGVTRGEGGHGVYALKCKNCHQDNNLNGDHLPPGSPTWALPPAHLKMVFEGKSPRELALHFKDNSFTGFKDFAKDMVHHVEAEPLVLQSWTHGTPPPLSHREFVAKVKEWIDKGAAIPDK
jgi:hypothetical protein